MKNNSGWLQGKKKERGGEITVEVGSSKTAAIVTGCAGPETSRGPNHIGNNVSMNLLSSAILRDP